MPYSHFNDETPVFLFDEKGQVGPIPFRRARELCKSEQVGEEAYFWAGGMADWRPVSDLLLQSRVIPPVLNPLFEKHLLLEGISQPSGSGSPTTAEKSEKSPLAPKEERWEGQTPLSVVQERKSRVLVVDDDMLIREMIGDLLDQQGLLWEKADDIKPACELMEKKGLSYFDAVITDYQTPGGSGVELVRWVKQRENALQILLLTAKDDKEVVKSGLRAGVMDFLDKPVRKKMLLPALELAIRETVRQREERSAYLELIRMKLAGRGGAAESLMTDLVHRESSVGGLLAKLETVMKYSEELEKRNAEVFPGSNVYVSEMPFQGQIADLSLLELSQLLSQSNKTGELQVMSTAKQVLGSMYFAEGRLSHAMQGTVEGKQALARLMGQTTGYFCFHYGRLTSGQTLFEDTTSLLLSISAEMDEKSKAIAA